MIARRVTDSATRRVRKLLRLSESPNAHEAALAAEQARALMDQHGISAEDVAEDVIEVVVESGGDIFRVDMARIVAASLSCAAVTSDRGGIAFRGRKEIAKRAGDAYRALAREADRASEMSLIGAPPPAARKVWRICFWIGFVEAVAERLLPSQPPRSSPARPNHGSAAKEEAIKGGTPPPEHIPPQIKEAFDACTSLAAILAGTVDDVQGVIERLRHRAHTMGRSTGDNASKKAAGSRAERHHALPSAPLKEE